jgi:asparagine synthase (glutamine-hydrolysing)
MRPFYYHYAKGEQLVFASDARDVLRFPGVPFAINEGRIADFIVQELEWIDYTSTFYKDIHRLPPAHQITIDRTGLRLTEYRLPVPGPTLRLKSDEEYKEALLDVLSRAVFERQRVTGGEAGSMLSGGMDSGSIVAIAEKPLRTYSLARRRGAECDESRRIYATLDFLKLEGTQVIADESDGWVDELAAKLAEPYDGQFLFLKAI